MVYNASNEESIVDGVRNLMSLDPSQEKGELYKYQSATLS